MAGLVRNTEKPAKETTKGGTYIRLHGDVQSAFKDLMRSLDFDPDSPRADAGVRKVGEMVAAMGIELARACISANVNNLEEYVAHVTASDKAETEAEPKAEDKAEDKK
jgi:hypothetical protein